MPTYNTNTSSSQFISLLTLLALLLTPSLSLTNDEAQFIYNEYNSRRSKYHKNWKDLKIEFFNIYFKADIFNRVSNVNKYLGEGSGGFVFLCEYTMPVSGEVVSAAIKFIPDGPGDVGYQDNMVLAYLTGTRAEDKYDSTKTRNFSIDNSKNIVQINMGEEKDPNSLYINQFYEMQFVPAKIVKSTRNMTLMVTGAGTQDLNSSMFQGKWNKGQTSNTEEFLRIYHEYCIGAANVNHHKILHGDHKPPNAILELDQNNIRHPAIIDFDIMGNFMNPERDNYEDQLRFTEGYRAPSIESKSIIKSKQVIDQSGQKVIKSKTFYYFTLTMNEDTYAMGMTFKKMIAKNTDDINTIDHRIQNIKTVINRLWNAKPFNISKIPTTARWAEMVDSLIKAGSQGYDLVDIYAPPPVTQQIQLINPSNQMNMDNKFTNNYINTKSRPSQMISQQQHNEMGSKQIVYNARRNSSKLSSNQQSNPGMIKSYTVLDKQKAYSDKKQIQDSEFLKQQKLSSQMQGEGRINTTAKKPPIFGHVIQRKNTNSKMIIKSDKQNNKDNRYLII